MVISFSDQYFILIDLIEFHKTWVTTQLYPVTPKKVEICPRTPLWW